MGRRAGRAQDTRLQPRRGSKLGVAIPRATLAAVLLGQVVAGGCGEGGRLEERGGPEAPAVHSESVTPLDSLLQESTNGVIAYHSTVDGGIVLVDPATGRKTFLTRGSSPEWSSGGTEISFMRRGRIHVIGANGTGEREIPVDLLPFESPYMVRPVLSSTDDRIAYSRQGEIELWRPGGGIPVFLMRPGPEDDRMPVWSPDGRRLAFVRDDDIWIVGADGSEPRRLTADQAANFDPDWSPTGDRIAFSSQRSGEVRIWTIAADGSDARGVTREIGGEAYGEHHPSWSPDGAEVVFERWGSQKGPQDADIYIASMESGTVRPLVRAPGFDGLPSWGRGRPAEGSHRE